MPSLQHAPGDRPQYKDFPKYDVRRYVALLLAIERMGERATMHYLSLELGCTRADVARAVEAANKSLMTVIEKAGPVYRVSSWGVLDRTAVMKLMLGREAAEQQELQRKVDMTYNRDYENDLLERCVSAGTAGGVAVSADEADVFRVAAQLVKTRYSNVAASLELATAKYFQCNPSVSPRSFPDVVRSGLVRDLPRVRGLLEQKLKGVRTW